jgi:hypothetical protein
MQIYIPTFGRVEQRVTYRSLPAELRPVLVAYKDEARQYRELGCNVLEVPPGVKGIAAKRHWLVHEGHNIKEYGPNIIMLDDDLRWYERRKDEPDKFQPATPASLKLMFKEVEKMLNRHVHGAIAAREQANRCTAKYRFNTRPLRALAYDVAMMRKLGIPFNRLPFMEDFDVTLQLLRAGYGNFIVNDWVHNQSGSGATGGCSASRTPEKQAACAIKLAKLHPGFVKVVQKSTKTAWAESGMTTRTDVVIQWKRAFQGSPQESLLV